MEACLHGCFEPFLSLSFSLLIRDHHSLILNSISWSVFDHSSSSAALYGFLVRNQSVLLIPFFGIFALMKLTTLYSCSVHYICVHSLTLELRKFSLPWSWLQFIGNQRFCTTTPVLSTLIDGWRWMIRYVRLNSSNVLSTAGSQSAGEKWEWLDELAPCCALINNGMLHKRCSARLCSILTDEVAALQVMSLTYGLSHSPQSNKKL